MQTSAKVITGPLNSQSLSKDQVDLGIRKIEELLYLILSRWQDA
jgi:hypothetical protein